MPGKPQILQTGNRMFLINPYRFGSFDPSVNGKMPIAAWIPSRDNEGNGTTTLTDFVGGSNGTLTSMDAGTDWVTDVDAGGVRALDFDGVDDNVVATLSASLDLTADFSMSCWIKLPTTSESGPFFKIGGDTATGVACGVGGTTFDDSPSNFLISLRETIAWHATAFSLGTDWFHCVYTFEQSTSNVYINGVLRQTFAGGFFGTSSTNQMSLGGYSSRITSMRGDDWRLFSTLLDATDRASLYASASGRGVDAA